MTTRKAALRAVILLLAMSPIPADAQLIGLFGKPKDSTAKEPKKATSDGKAAQPSKVQVALSTEELVASLRAP